MSPMECQGRPLRVALHSASVVLLCVAITLATIPFASAKKELPLNTAFPTVVKNAMRCDVCSFIVANALNQVETKRDELKAKRLPLREDDILEQTEGMCIPFKDQGQWMRQVSLLVVPKTPTSAAAPPYTMEVGVVDYYGRCGRTCSTVAALCEELMDRDVMDDFPGGLLKASRDANMTDEAHRNTIFAKFCYPSPYCKQHGKYVAALEKALQKDADLLAALRKEKPRRIKQEELEMETMMYRLTREQRQAADVFSRDEIQKMQEAFVYGTKEDVAAIDPKAFDLSDDEFEALREHMKADQRFTGGSGGRKSARRHAVEEEDDDDDDL